MEGSQDFKSVWLSQPERLAEAYRLEARDRDYFSSIAWTAKLMEDPDFTNLPLGFRVPNPDTDQGSFLAETLNTHGTIRHLLVFHRNLTAPNTPVVEMRWLIDLGTKLNGWPRVLHGGMQSFLLDEIMAWMLACGRDVPGASLFAPSTVTAELKVRFIRAAQTPGVLIAEARVTKQEGRKVWTEAKLKNQQGVVVATGEGLFIGVKEGAGPKI
jgi:acyl-coenzyme A thioesterase PaaI-like protein